MRFFFTVSWVGLQYVIVVHVFPDHTHFFLMRYERDSMLSLAVVVDSLLLLLSLIMDVCVCVL